MGPPRHTLDCRCDNSRGADALARNHDPPPSDPLRRRGTKDTQPSRRVRCHMGHQPDCRSGGWPEGPSDPVPAMNNRQNWGITAHPSWGGQPRARELDTVEAAAFVLPDSAHYRTRRQDGAHGNEPGDQVEGHANRPIRVAVRHRRGREIQSGEYAKANPKGCRRDGSREDATPRLTRDPIWASRRDLPTFGA
jgi:hypothetical protein